MADITKANTFITWLRSKGGEFHQSAELQIDPETGLSPVSISDIAPDERLVSCPFKLAITSEIATQAICEITNTREEDLVWPAESSRQGEKWNARMRIGGYLGLHWIYQDKQKDGSSFPPALQHLPYLEALPPPSTLTTPLYFSAEEVELLKGSTLYGGVKAREEEWKSECEVVRKVLKEDGLTWERYLATSTYMSSRSFPSKLLRIPDQADSATHEAKKDNTDVDSQPVLLPGLDLFNHSRGQPILWLSSLIPSSTSPNQPIPSISLVSTQPTEKGTQLYNNYGPKSNEELLLGYGFVIPSNPDDTVTLKLGIPHIPHTKLEKLTAKGLDANKRFELRRDGKMDKDLLEILRIILNEHDHEHEHEIDEEDEHALHAEEEREMQLELDVLGMLGGMLDDKLDKLQDTPVETGEKIREEVRKMCEIYKQGQVDILNTAMDKLSERIERIEGLIDEGMGGCPCGC